MFTGMSTGSVTSPCGQATHAHLLTALGIVDTAKYVGEFVEVVPQFDRSTRSARSGQVHDGRTRGIGLHGLDPVERPRPRGVALADGRRPQPCCPRHPVGSPLSGYIYGEKYKRWHRRMLL